MAEENVNVGELLDQMGGFGMYQIYTFLLACYSAGLPGLLLGNMNFVGYEPKHRCLVPVCETSNAPSYYNSFLNFTTPTLGASNDTWDSCAIYSYSQSLPHSEGYCKKESFDQNSEVNCSKFVFDTSLLDSTAITEFGLVCEKGWYIPFANSIYMVGMMVGALVLGDLGDRIGRKKSLVIAGVIMAGAGILNGLSTSYIMFLITRLFTGLGTVSVFQISFVVAVEAAPKKWRRFVGIMIELPFALAESSVAIFAYFLRDWRWIQISTALPSVLILAYWWIMPESVRWLIMKGKYKEAKRAVEKIEEVNNIKVDNRFHAILDSENAIDLGRSSKSEDSMAKKTEKRNVLDIFNLPTTRKRTLMLMYSWFAVTLTYFGLSLNSANFGNLFVSFSAMMLIEIPSYLFAYFIIDVFGQKGSMTFLMLLGGLACFAAAAIPTSMTTLLITLSMIGKFGISAGFAVVFIYTTEIYPTMHRSIGLGCCSMTSKIGGILAPLITNLNKVFQSLPFVIFGILAVLSGLLFFFLPETYGCDLPQTLQESENFGKDQPGLYFKCFDKKNGKKIPNEVK